VVESRGYSASEIFSNIDNVTLTRTIVILPTDNACTGSETNLIQTKFSQFVAVLKEQNRTEFE
jgi:hypothetical protein